MTKRWRTALVGAGKIGTGYAADPVMSRHFKYATHAQVLREHPAFEWIAVVDPSEEALAAAQSLWRVPIVARSVEELPARCEPDVLVLATPPHVRRAAIEAAPSVRAVLVEKPLGSTIDDARSFLAFCEQRHILVQVNLWRRADEVLERLRDGELARRIGAVQGGFCVYGNGLRNNGTHMIDLVRMLVGEVRGVQALSSVPPWRAGPLDGDVHVPFTLSIDHRVAVACLPLDFACYRENGLDLWGTNGRLVIDQEGLGVKLFSRTHNRAMSGEFEIASDQPELLEPTAGVAFYRMYSNLAAALEEHAALCSDGASALVTTRIVAAVERSAALGGAFVEVEAVA
jgi:predicted dehydrogenase